ncbi:MAG: hypothetical protein ACO3E4_08300 [Candidatus Nanopelagicaceae bacterium]
MASKRQRLEAAMKKLIKGDEWCSNHRRVQIPKKFCYECLADVALKALEVKKKKVKG